MSDGYESLDASRPWIVYWIVHSLEMLDEYIDSEEERAAVIDFLAR